MQRALGGVSGQSFSKKCIGRQMVKATYLFLALTDFRDKSHTHHHFSSLKFTNFRHAKTFWGIQEGSKTDLTAFRMANCR